VRGLSEQLLQELGALPEPLRPALRSQLPRTLFEARLVGPPRPPGLLVDLGGGISLLPFALLHLGWRVRLVDDLHQDYGGYDFSHHRARGIAVERADLLSWRPREQLGGALCIATLEHLHHSPRPLFSAVVRQLKPGGLFLLGAPNAVNLRKRLAVPLGLSNWSRFDDWWVPKRFHGHVREPTLGELRQMVRSLGLCEEERLGRNFLGLQQRGLTGLVARALDLPLRALPQLCSDLYLKAVRPEE
jgi:SAM-dependent methyltransferase